MEQFCIIERNLVDNHAGAKARNDVCDILTGNGWIPLTVHHNEDKGTLDKLKMIFVTGSDWSAVSHKVPANATVLIQYPLAMYPKVSLAAVPFIRGMRRKHVKIIYLIHDLDGLRGVDQKKERMFLKEADVILVHNAAMEAYLRKNGYAEKKTVRLELFDYLIPGFAEKAGGQWDRKTVIIAGNLQKEKAGYVYQLDHIDGNVRFRLYGPNFQPGTSMENAEYMGQFPPDQLPEKLHGGFGLVWDGVSIETCAGVFGEYLRYNNPHKASLYLASGLPVIVWRESAIASYVEKHQLGITVSSLREIPRRLEAMDDDEYAAMKRAACRLAEKLRTGSMLKTALREAQE